MSSELSNVGELFCKNHSSTVYGFKLLELKYIFLFIYFYFQSFIFEILWVNAYRKEDMVPTFLLLKESLAFRNLYFSYYYARSLFLGLC